MKKIKILHRAATTGVGGVEKFVMNHYRFMDHDKFQIDFITRNESLKFNNEVQELGINVRTFTATEYNDRDLLISQISNILDDDYEVLHMNTSMWAGFLIEEIAMERKIPRVIVHSHSTGIDMPDSKLRQQYLERHEYYKERFGKEYATHFCACSREAADWLFGPQISREDISIIKNAIEVEKFEYNYDIGYKIKRNLGIENKYVIGHIGRFSYQKNHEFLINVFNIVHKRNPDTVLLLFGMGENEKQIRSQIKELGLTENVFLMGYVDDMYEYYNAIDMFVLPSRFEGLSVAAIEAQASGMPVLLSDNLSKETIITEKAKMLPLDEDVWSKEIFLQMDIRERKSMYDVITKAGYNIKENVKILEHLYSF